MTSGLDFIQILNLLPAGSQPEIRVCWRGGVHELYLYKKFLAGSYSGMDSLMLKSEIENKWKKERAGTKERVLSLDYLGKSQGALLIDENREHCQVERRS